MKLTIKLAEDQGGQIITLCHIRSYDIYCPKGRLIPVLSAYKEKQSAHDGYHFPGAQLLRVEETSPAQQLRFGLLADEYNQKEQESDLKTLIKEVRQLRGVMAKILERT